MREQCDWLRPKDAAARFSVSRSQLHVWAADGLIASSKPSPGVTFFDAADIAEVIESNKRPRRVVSLTPRVVRPPEPEDDWLAYLEGRAR